MLREDILSTIIYYDLLEYPLTAFEIWKYLIKRKKKEEKRKSNEEKYFLADVVRVMENEELKKYIEEFRGFYFLKGRKFLVKQRLERNKISEMKFKIVRKVSRWLCFIPFVIMIAVTGSLAMKNAEAQSDLDLLIVLKRGKIFTGRTLVTLVIHLLGRRRYADKITNRICLNFFITDKSLEIRPRLQDLFSSSEYFFARPVFGEKVFREFQKANQWIKNFRVNFGEGIEKQHNVETQGDTKLAEMIRKTGKAVLDWDWLERILRNWQTKRINKDPRTHLLCSIIIADENSLIFLPEPQGPKIIKKFEENYHKLFDYKIGLKKGNN